MNCPSLWAIGSWDGAGIFFVYGTVIVHQNHARYKGGYFWGAIQNRNWLRSRRSLRSCSPISKLTLITAFFHQIQTKIQDYIPQLPSVTPHSLWKGPEILQDQIRPTGTLGAPGLSGHPKQTSAYSVHYTISMQSNHGCWAPPLKDTALFLQ